MRRRPQPALCPASNAYQNRLEDKPLIGVLRGAEVDQRGYPRRLKVVPGVSVAAAIIECMFDTLPLDPAAFSDADDAAVVAAIEDWARIEAAAGARRLARDTPTRAATS